MGTRRTVLVQLNSLELGGTQLNAVDLAKAVEAHGYDSVIFGPSDTLPESGPSLLEVAAARGVAVEPYVRAPGVLRGGVGELERRARRIGADIVHVYGADGDPRSAYWGACRGGRRGFVHTVYEMTVHPSTFRHNSLVVGTAYLRDELADRPGPTTLISPPVDVESDGPNEAWAAEFRTGLGQAGHAFLVVIVSRLYKSMKALPVETAIESMSHLADLGAALVVVGGGEEEERLRALGDRINTGFRRPLVHFTGPLADPKPAYAAADVMLGMGGSAARSLAFAKPLIVQGELGTSELFDAQSAESLFRRSFWNPEPQDRAARCLAGAVRELISQPDRRSDLGRFGREFAIANFSLPAMAERLAAVYDESRSRYDRSAWIGDFPRELPELVKSVRSRLGGGRNSKAREDRG